jgi:phenylacetate-CoA ligase
MIFHDIEIADRDVIERGQFHDLKKTLDTAQKNVLFYSNKFSNHHFTLEQLNDLADLQKVPFSTKKDLRDHYPFGLLAVERKDLSRIHASSGTTGKPTIVGYTKTDIENWADIVARAIATAGGTRQGIIHNSYGYGLFTGGLGLHHGAEKLGMAVVPASVGNTERQITLIEDIQPDIICATPSYALNLAERMAEMGKDPRKTSLKFGIFGAEPWSEEMRKELEEAFDIKACDIYGLSEVIGPGVAIECQEAQDGLHIAEDHFIVEVIDPVTLERLPDGQEGELVFTSLKKEAFPVIRYRTGDIASINREICKCGRTTMRMSRIKGRIDDMLIIKGVNVYPSEIEICILKIKDLSPHYQLLLVNNRNLNEVTLQVEISEDLYKQVERDLSHEKIQTLHDSLQAALKGSCLITIPVNLLAPKTIPRSEGKAIRIIDTRRQELAR